jgi:Leucine-rich repeat (LRR) protein
MVTMDTKQWTLTIVLMCVVVMATGAHGRGASKKTLDGSPCPKTCNCDWPTSYMHCTGTIPDTHDPIHVRHLSFRGNPVQHLTFNVLSAFRGVNILDLGETELERLDEDTFSHLPDLQELHLDHNQLNSTCLAAINQIGNQLLTLNLANNHLDTLVEYVDMGNWSVEWLLLSNVSNLVTLDLSHNRLDQLPQSYLVPYGQLQSFNVSHNRLEHVDRITRQYDENVTEIRVQYSLTVLDLSFNSLQTLDCVVLADLASMRDLHLEHNDLYSIGPACFSRLHHLQSLDLSYNPTVHIARDAFHHCVSLQHLTLTHMPNMTYVDYQSFQTLTLLKTLRISHNPNFANLHADTFLPLGSLEVLDLSYNGLRTVFHPIFNNLSALHVVYLHGNPWSCDCEALWLRSLLIANHTRPRFMNPGQITCTSPAELRGAPLTNVPALNFSCSGATIVNHTVAALHKIGSSALLSCHVSGSPKPVISWITPSGLHLRHVPAYVNWANPGPHQVQFHDTHHWHRVDDYFIFLPHHDRVHVLKNGSLYIDYVQRFDAGHYRCIAQNELGNQTVVIGFLLNMAILEEAYVWSLLVGFCSSACFFVVGLIIGALRFLGNKCSREERQRRKSIRQILKSVEAYRTAQFGKLGAYKSAKIDQLSAFKEAKLDKVRSYSNVTLHTLVQHLERMRDNYSTSVNNIKDNCTNQADKLRDNYAAHMGKFKDYREHHIDKIRDNYNYQVFKIRDYGSQQLERLRDQYKQQQNYVLKIIELLDIGNCMAVVEAECMRTESMLFNPDIQLDFDTNPVHILPPLLLAAPVLDYETAASHADPMAGHSGTGKRHHKRHKHRHKHRHRDKDSTTVAVVDGAQPLPSTTKHRHRRKKHRHRRHRHHDLLANLNGNPDDLNSAHRHGDDDHNSETEDVGMTTHHHKRRKTPVPKHLANTATSPSESGQNDLQSGHQRRHRGHHHRHCHHHHAVAGHEASPGKESGSIYMTGHSEQDYTDYESAIQSRDQTPEGDHHSISIVSIPSSPSTPTLTTERECHVIIMDPDTDSLCITLEGTLGAPDTETLPAAPDTAEHISNRESTV